MVNVHFINIKAEIIQAIQNSKSKVLVCMAWFTDEDILNALITQIKKGIFVEIILFDHTSNHVVGRQITAGIDHLNDFKIGLSRYNSAGGKIVLIKDRLDFYLHSKFCVIDDTMVITGSYNWSLKAISNIENVVIITDSYVASEFTMEYQRIKERKMELVTDRLLHTCQHCTGKVFKGRLYDFRDGSQDLKFYHDILFCSNNPVEHLEILDHGEEHTFFAELFEDEYDRFEQNSDNGNHDLLNANIETRIASYFNSRSDLFSLNIGEDILLIGVIKEGLDGLDNEFEEIDFYWCHDVIKPFKDEVSLFEEEIIERLRFP